MIYATTELVTAETGNSARDPLDWTYWAWELGFWVEWVVGFGVNWVWVGLGLG